MKRSYLTYGFLICSLLLIAAVPSKLSDNILSGFTKENSQQQLELEKKFDSFLSADHLRARMKRMSSQPNQLGSPHDKKNAEFLKKQFTSWGFDAKIEKFEVLFPTPKERVLEMTSPKHFKASLKEQALKEDATSSIMKNSLPP